MACAAIVEFVRPASSHLETLAGAGSNAAAVRSVDDKTELHVGNTPHLCLPLSTSHFSPCPQENHHEAHFSSSRPDAWRCRIFCIALAAVIASTSNQHRRSRRRPRAERLRRYDHRRMSRKRNPKQYNTPRYANPPSANSAASMDERGISAVLTHHASAGLANKMITAVQAVATKSCHP